MPGCSAVGCNNRSEKGYIMKCFPRDPKLRKIWQERVARADWEPSNNSFLCHVHFDPEEWSITQSGRIRLKKNAVPTIFTITSTRKSPKKRIKLTNMKNEKKYENDYIMEYLENDMEHSSTGNLEEKDSDSQDLDDPSIPSFINCQVNHSPTMTENKQVLSEQYKDVAGEQEGIILIPKDSNMELENSINDYNSGKQMGNNLTQNQNKNVAKTREERKGEIDQVSLDDSYDEIEEKLKQICNGYREENMSNNVEKLNSISRNQKKSLEQSAMQVPFNKNINYKYSSKNTIENILTNNAENIEIIFGSESEEECVHVFKYTSNNVTNRNDKLNQGDTDINNIADKQNDETCFNKGAEEYFNREHSYVTSNIRAAMKRKWRTREEIMKSVKKSIRTISSQDTISVSNSDTSDNNAEVESKIEKELNICESIKFDKDDTTQAKFTIKVTGEREDVIDIMQDLFQDTKDFTIQEHDSMHKHEGNHTLITSVVTIDDCSQIKTNARDERNRDILQSSIIDIKSRNDDHMSYDLSTLKTSECLNAKLIPSHFNEESNDRDINSDCLSLDVNNVTEQVTATRAIKYDYQKLQKKVKMQEDVIRKLTNQLILYKDLEKDLKNKNFALEIKTMCEYDTKTDNGLSPTSCKKNMNSKETLIKDLSNRISYFLDVNKKLMKTITMECHQKRELEGQIKQKDTLIKELNWKLQKASKFFDRAVKNVNTCKRKMLNMQTVMRRRKLLDEKLNQFNEMLIDNVKGGYSERAQAMAMEIKNICGENGYNKLLSFGFPFPVLPTLQASLHDNSSDSNKSNNEMISTALKYNPNEKYLECDGIYTKNGIKAHSKNHSERSKTVRKEMVLDSTETVTGTVQDIFEENNDIDDFATTELREHFISELNATM